MEFICRDCPRGCGALRGEKTGAGRCRSGALPRISRAAPHFGEEPCLTGTRGAGTVFFTGCALGCVFCQNREISRGGCGEELTVQELREVFRRLEGQGVHNIDLVTPSHFTRTIAEALAGMQLSIPVVWNSSAYECVETLRMLDGLVQIYLPDYKYADAALAKAYSFAPDYPERARAAIREMYRQTGDFVMGEDGLLKSGVLIRHLILPGSMENTRDVIDFVADEFPRGSVLFSLMSQYTPMPGMTIPALTRTVSEEENEALCHYMHTRHIDTGYWQSVHSAGEEMIPDFDGTGVR